MKRSHERLLIALVSLLLIALVSLLLIALVLGRQGNKTGHDFFAYYDAAARLLRGESPYAYRVHYAYKYPPAFAVFFTPFALFPFDVARWIYAVLHAGLSVGLPFAVARFTRTPVWGHRAFFVGYFVSLLATLRFLDNEWEVSQIGLWLFAALLAGLTLLRRSSPGARFGGGLLVGLATLTKVHSLVALTSFLKLRSWRGLVIPLLALIVLFLLPNPALWLDWYRQMRATGPDIPLDRDTVNLQGFYPIAVKAFGWSPAGLRPLLLALPFFAWALWKLPRFEIEDTREQPAPLLLTLSTWLLLGLLSSPLPWHYTYSFLWAVLPLAWVVGTRGERRMLFLLALFSGLTPKGIVGRDVSFFLERHQSLVVVFLGFAAIFAAQSLRLTRPKDARP